MTTGVVWECPECKSIHRTCTPGECYKCELKELRKNCQHSSINPKFGICMDCWLSIDEVTYG